MMLTSTMRRIHGFALLAACLAVTASPSSDVNPRIVKTTFKTTLLDLGPIHGRLVGLRPETKVAESGSTIDAPTNNAVLKVVASVKAGANQTFTEVLIDTGSAIFWVGGEKPYEPGPNTESLGTNFSIGYGAGGAEGPAYKDTVTIGNATVKSQIIGAANVTNGFDEVKPIDGILGLGPADSNSGQIVGYNSTPTFIESLVAEGTVDQAVFGIHISSLDAVTGGQITQGEIAFGGVDEDRITGDVVWLPQTQPTNFRWAFNVVSLQFGDLELTNTSMPGRTDTGVLPVGLPFDSLFSILHAVPGATIVSEGFLDGFLGFPSNASATSLPPISLGLGDQVFELPASKYLVPKALYSSLNLTGDITYSWLGSAGTGGFMLGQKWLEGIYTAYDMKGKRVGFAHLK